MKRYRLMVGLALAGSIALYATPYVLKSYASGLFPNFPIVGGASYCGGTLSSATGTLTGVQTGCPSQVPAGPTVVTGSETFPADTNLASGANPQTVLMTLASLNALPITVQAVTPATTPMNISAANTAGGVLFTSTSVGGITSVNVTFPLSPIDGQQYLIVANRNLGAMTLSAGANSISSTTLPLSQLNIVTTQPIGMRWVFNRASTTWLRIQ